ncbi:MAG: hypothetical protein EOO65_05020 [Methanosarcinales archaeon]|nr:MAG: hypothetical protein EOO65_05020 [Methanosarcinales archaeon]
MHLLLSINTFCNVSCTPVAGTCASWNGVSGLVECVNGVAQGMAFSTSDCTGTAIPLSNGCVEINSDSILATCVAGNSASNDNSARAAAYAMGGAAAAAAALFL